MSAKISPRIPILFVCGFILVLSALFTETYSIETVEAWPDHNDRFQVYEACHFKYGFVPVDPNAPKPPPHFSQDRARLELEHNAAMEECERTYYRQKFCRNQLQDLNKQPYQRICKSINLHYLKFYGMVFGVIGIGAFVRTFMKALKISVPYTVTLMLIGMVMGALTNITGVCVEWTPYTKVARTPPDIILNVFLPVLIFESSFNMKAHLFFRSIFSILILALPGMLMTTFLTAVLCQQFFFSYEWSFMVACLFGSIISATDPVAVVAILKEVGTSETLGVLVDGESLLNDGVAILLYEIFSEIIDEEDKQLHAEHNEGPGLRIFLLFIRITLGGPLFGWMVAKLAIRYLSLIFNDAAVEVSVTLCAAYLTYYIGEAFLGVSGVMALVLLGITISSERTCISPEVQGLVHHFWEMLGYLANTVLFVILGIVITETAINSFKPEDGYYLIFLYFSLNIVRLLMIGVLSPLLSRIGYGLSWQNMVVMSWGGLRGAVGVCLALQVFKNKIICHRENVGPKILLQTAGTVLLTLVINGTTTKYLLQLLKLTEISIGKIQDMGNAVRQLRSAQQKTLRILRHDRFLSDANWEIVESSTNINDPYLQRNITAKDKAKFEGHKVPSLVQGIEPQAIIQCPECDAHMDAEPGGDEMREMTEEARLRLLKALKVSCWRQYEQGVLTEKAVQILIFAWETLEDKQYKMLDREDIGNYCELRGFLVVLRKWLSKYNSGHFVDDEIPLPKEPWRHIFHRMAKSDYLPLLVYLIIIANVVLTCWEASYISEEDNSFTKAEYIMFYLINLAFTLIYLIEFGIKIAGMGFAAYMSSRFNILDVIILIIGIVEVVLSGTYLRDEIDQASDSDIVKRMSSSQEADFLKFVRFIRIIRVLRICRFFKPLIPATMRYLNNRINLKLFLAYDLGKGFITAVDDVQKFLPQIIEQPKILLKFKMALEFQRIEVVKDMGLLQKDHPGIAIAVKSRHASRSVLNHMKNILREMKEDGLVDEQEFASLTEEIEGRMKALWNSPSFMRPISAEFALANVCWMGMTYDAKELYEFIYSQAVLLSFSSGDVICNHDDAASGIYLIVAGLVRVHYEPTFEMCLEREEFGIIPNIELFHDVSFENDMEDYFSTASVIGELGVLTDMRRGASVTCETAVTAYHIPQSVMKAAMTKFEDPFDSLEARIWRTIGIKIATSLLPDEPEFASWQMEKVRAYLEKSAVPIQRQYDQLVIPDFVSEVVVIYGQYCNASDIHEVFTAPCLIPKYCRHICWKAGSPVIPKVLIIADENEIIDLWDDSDEEEGESEDEEGDDETTVKGFGLPDNGVTSSTIQRMIHAGSKGNSLTDEEVLSIQLQHQSKHVNMGAGQKTKPTNIAARSVKPKNTGDNAV